MSVNRVTLVGRLGQDLTVRHTESGTPVTNCSVATNERWTSKDGQRQEHTEWHRVVIWGKLAEICGKYLSKGREVYLEGKLQTRKWDDRDGNQRQTTEIVATNVTFLGNAPRNQVPNEAKGEPELSLENGVPF